jgi:hypothetical protein
MVIRFFACNSMLFFKRDGRRKTDVSDILVSSHDVNWESIFWYHGVLK